MGADRLQRALSRREASPPGRDKRNRDLLREAPGPGAVSRAEGVAVVNLTDGLRRQRQRSKVRNER